MRFTLNSAALVGMAALMAVPAAAWGPNTQETIVTTAVHLYAKQQNVPLDRREKDFREGVNVSMETLKDMYPGMAVSAISGIESEMALLQAVRGSMIDAYFAYRMGALGKLVCEVTAPMRDADPKYRQQYYLDVDRNISSGIAIKPAKRNLVDARGYFPERMAEARVNDDLIQEDYKSGAGFAGLAKALLQQDSSRTLSAVADVWHTVLAGPSMQANVSEAQKRAYVLRAFAFYTERGNEREIDDSAARLAKLTEQTPDMQVRIGDMLYEAMFFERAIQRYQTVLKTDPRRRDVVEKISEYYMKKGADALDEGNYEKAIEAYAQALTANPLHPTAEAERLKVTRLIKDRDERLALNQAHLERAGQFIQMAERDAARNLHAEAVASLRQALAAYGEVTQEFPMEHHKATRGIQETRIKIDRHKESLIIDAQDFGGSGFSLDARALAHARASELDKEALRALLRNAYRAEMQTLENDLQDALTLKSPGK